MASGQKADYPAGSLQSRYPSMFQGGEMAICPFNNTLRTRDEQSYTPSVQADLEDKEQDRVLGQRILHPPQSLHSPNFSSVNYPQKAEPSQ